MPHNQWRSMRSAPRNGDPIFLLLERHGVVEARFDQGTWSDETPDHGREYSGSAWICGDDVFQIEVDELPIPYGYHDAGCLGWLPRSALPPETNIEILPEELECASG